MKLTGSLTNADSLLKTRCGRTPVQLRKEVLRAKVGVFVRQRVVGSIHRRRAQDLMGELMYRRASDATTDGLQDRFAICCGGSIRERAQRDSVEIHSAGAPRSTE